MEMHVSLDGRGGLTARLYRVASGFASDHEAAPAPGDPVEMTLDGGQLVVPADKFKHILSAGG